jgi:hypothetical protein
VALLAPPGVAGAPLASAAAAAAGGAACLEGGGAAGEVAAGVPLLLGGGGGGRLADGVPAAVPLCDGAGGGGGAALLGGAGLLAGCCCCDGGGGAGGFCPAASATGMERSTGAAPDTACALTFVSGWSSGASAAHVSRSAHVAQLSPHARPRHTEAPPLGGRRDCWPTIAAGRA